MILTFCCNQFQIYVGYTCATCVLYLKLNVRTMLRSYSHTMTSWRPLEGEIRWSFFSDCAIFKIPYWCALAYHNSIILRLEYSRRFLIFLLDSLIILSFLKIVWPPSTSNLSQVSLVFVLFQCMSSVFPIVFIIFEESKILHVWRMHWEDINVCL